MATCPHCGAPHAGDPRFCPSTGQLIPEHLLPAGSVLEGKYRVGRVLGVGGMGAVFAARHLLLDKAVAVKVTLPATEEVNEELAARMVREARAASAIEHPHIAQVLDLGYFEEGSLFVVMEYLEGQTLADILEHEGRLPLARAATLMCQALAGLEAVHRKQILHRDLKPENFMVVRDEDGAEQLKILDFGISKPLHCDAALQLTSPGLLVGTPHYMAPEAMLRPAEIDPRADLYAVGVVLYRLLTGNLPYPQASLNALIAAQQDGPPAPPSQLAPGLPRTLDALVLRALARRPEERFPDARAFRVALEPFTRGSAAVEAPASLPTYAPSLDLLDEGALVSLDEATAPEPAGRPASPPTARPAPQPASRPAPRPASRPAPQPEEPPPADPFMPRFEEEELLLAQGNEAAPRAKAPPRVVTAPELRRASAPPAAPAAPLGAPRSPARRTGPYGQARKEQRRPLRWVLALLGLGAGGFALWHLLELRGGGVLPARSDAQVSHQVRISVEGAPPAAQILVDGEPRPLPLLLGRSSQPVRITARAAGYRSRTVTIVPEEDQPVTLTLEPESRGSSPDERRDERRDGRRKAGRRYLHSSKRATTSR